MATQSCTEDEFIETCRKYRSCAKVARHFGISERAVLARRRAVEGRRRIDLPFDKGDHRRKSDVMHAEQMQDAALTAIAERRVRMKEKDRKRLSAPLAPDDVEHIPSDWRYRMTMRNGTIIVGSDAHYKPDIVSTAHRALVQLVKRIKPDVIVLNGDLLDGSSISRHFRIRWHKVFQVKDELDAVKDRLGEIEAVAANAKLIRTWGNHDSNFETRLSGHVPQYEGVGGFTLWEHLPRWQPCMSVFVNDERGMVIKHRYKGGLHAPHNNVLWAGRHMVTGHLHSQKVQPITNYNGTLYGTDTGCLASPEDETFHYAEDDPRNWRSGFGVFTFVDGEMMPPELVTVTGAGRVWFRGEIHHV